MACEIDIELACESNFVGVFFKINLDRLLKIKPISTVELRK